MAKNFIFKAFIFSITLNGFQPERKLWKSIAVGMVGERATKAEQQEIDGISLDGS